MKKKVIINKKLIKLLVITLICVLNFEIINLVNSSMVFASSATDYDFTDELDADRVGIGFTWIAENRTLEITGIKNDSANIKLPDNSTIDIQGNIENTIGGLSCDGSLVVKGNDVASLNVTKCNCSTPIGYLSCVAIGDTLTIENGNMNIISTGVGYSMSQSTYAGIYSKKVIINDGNLNINVGGLRSKSQILYAIFINMGNITINGGNVQIEVKDGDGVTGETIINAGNIEVATDNTYSAFVQVPSINPTLDWKILYSNDSESEEIEADIIDIYNIYNSPVVKIYEKFLMGDLNNDKKVNVKDWNLMYSYINETSELNINQLECADTNEDGKVNIKDWNRLYNHITEVDPLL